jgi:hypothetical protein
LHRRARCTSSTGVPSASLPCHCICGAPQCPNN